VTRDAGN